VRRVAGCERRVVSEGDAGSHYVVQVTGRPFFCRIAIKSPPVEQGSAENKGFLGFVS
jgi:hypothetical protein